MADALEFSATELAALEAEAAEGRKPVRRKEVKPPLARFVEPMAVPVAESTRRIVLSPKRFTPASVEFKLVGQDGDRLTYIGTCPRCESGLIVAHGVYHSGKTTVGGVPQLCLECENRIDDLLEASSGKADR